MIYTSANTSINSEKLPRIFSKISDIWEEYSAVLDYGCGKYTDHIKGHCMQHNKCYLPVDPYNQSGMTNINI